MGKMREARRGYRSKLTLVAQEIKAEQEPHYHDNEKQRKSDNVTDIHDW